MAEDLVVVGMREGVLVVGYLFVAGVDLTLQCKTSRRTFTDYKWVCVYVGYL